MRRAAWLAGVVLALSACQPLEGLLKLKPDLPRTAASVAVDAAVATAADASATPSTASSATPAALASTASDSATPTPAPTGIPTPFLTFSSAPDAASPSPAASVTPTPHPTATPTPSQPTTCTRTRQVISVAGPQHGRFNGMVLPREWATVYANEDEILRGIDNVYQTDWACFQAFYPEATAVYKQLRGRS